VPGCPSHKSSAALAQNTVVGKRIVQQQCFAYDSRNPSVNHSVSATQITLAWAGFGHFRKVKKLFDQ
jgi:hypothetical protein